MLILFLLGIVAYLLLSKTILGRYTFAIGSNEEATRLSGVNTRRWKIFIYTVAGVFTGIAGVVIAARLDSAQPQSGVGYELQAIAAVIIGGTSLLGGRGSIMGTVIGALIMSVLINGLRIMSIQTEWQNVVVGIVILIAVFTRHPPPAPVGPQSPEQSGNPRGRAAFPSESRNRLHRREYGNITILYLHVFTGHPATRTRSMAESAQPLIADQTMELSMKTGNKAAVVASLAAAALTLVRLFDRRRLGQRIERRRQLQARHRTRLEGLPAPVLAGREDRAPRSVPTSSAST